MSTPSVDPNRLDGRENVSSGGDSPPQRDETARIVEQLRSRGPEALADLFSKHRRRLRRLVELRLSQQLRGRVDASDVLQEAFLDASRRLDDYVKKPSMPFFLWLRFLTRQKLLALHRHHVGTQARDPRREVSLYGGAMPEATTEALAAQFLGHSNTPSKEVVQVETRIRLQEALNSLDPLDREVLALRHFEQLGNAECARELGISDAAASKRYIRAVFKLKGILLHLGLESGAL